MYGKVVNISFTKGKNEAVIGLKSLEWLNSFDAPVDDSIYDFHFDCDVVRERSYLYKVVESKSKGYASFREAILDLNGKSLFLNDGFCPKLDKRSLAQVEADERPTKKERRRS